jgi:hypothetical protein
MYRIVKDNWYTFVYWVEYRFLWLFWIKVSCDSLEECRAYIALKKLPKSKRYTVVE